MAKGRIDIINLHSFADKRGELVSTDRLIPFDIKNVFVIYGTDYPRGGHAHKKCAQVLIPLRGTIDVQIEGAAFILASHRHGVYVPPGNRIDMQFHKGAILFVLCSEFFDPDDYIQ